MLLLVLGTAGVTGLALEGPIVPTWLSLALSFGGFVAGVVVGEMMRRKLDVGP